MNVLVTGGCGYVGSHIVVELLEVGYDVSIIDNFCNSEYVVIDKIESITGRRPKLFSVDIRSEGDMNAVFDHEDFQCVIHCAGLKSIGKSIGNPLRYYDYNVSGSFSLLKSMQKHNCKNLIFSSSASVYGNITKVPIRETETLETCTNPYSKTKVIIEEALKELQQSDSQWNVVVLRYFNPVGAHPSGLIGDAITQKTDSLMAQILKVADGQESCLVINGDTYNTPDGTAIRDFIHIVDLAKGHIDAINLLNQQCGYEVCNIGTGIGYSVLEMVKKFIAVSGQDIPYEFGQRRKGDIAISYADVEKAANQLNFKAEYTLSDMCRDSWNWYKKNK